MKTSTFVLVSLLSLSLAGCAKKTPEPKSAASSGGGSESGGGAPAAGGGGDKACSSDADCATKQLCIRNRCVDISPDLAECSVVHIHFAFNEAEILSDDKALLERSARCLKADHDLHVVIEGNTDERGTEEFNLALGDRRATAVSKYLQALGASSTQLRTVSYGEESPLCSEHDEACWAKNRRAQVKPGTTAKPPAPAKPAKK